MAKRLRAPDIKDLSSLRVSMAWRRLTMESFSFWMICAYLFFEYVRPQSIYPGIDFLPWTQCAAIGALLGALTDKSIKWVSSPINSALLLLFVVLVVSSAFSYYPDISFSNLENIYIWIIIYFLIINIVNTKERYFIFLCIFLLASFKLSFSLSLTWAQRGFAFTDWGLKGPPGYFQNSGELAVQMLMFWPVALAFSLSVKPYVKRILYLCLLLMPLSACLVVLGASSRGAQLALVCQIIAIGYKKLFKLKIIIGLIFAVTLMLFMLPEEQKARFHEIGTDKSSQQRLLYWENGFEMMNDHPILGVGFYNFIPYYERFYSEDVLYSFAQLPHNIFVQMGTDAGYLGLAIYLFIILKCCFVLFSGKITGFPNDEEFWHLRKALVVSLIGFVVAGQFVSIVYYPFLWIHLALTVSFANVHRKKLRFEGRSAVRSTDSKKQNRSFIDLN